MNKKNLKIISLIILIVLVIILSIIGITLNFNMVSYLVIITIFSSLGLLIWSTTKSILSKDIFQPVMVFNAIYFFVFILRPIYLLYFGMDNSSVVNVYYNLYYAEIRNIDFLISLIIGFMGQICLYLGYYFYEYKSGEIKFQQLGLRKPSKNQKNIVSMLFLFTAVFMTYYLLKYSNGDIIGFLTLKNRIKFSTVNILWIYVGTITVLFQIYTKRKISITIIIFMLIIIVLSSGTGHRSFPFNLLLSSVVLSYYWVYKKKLSFKLIVLTSVAIVSILVYGFFRLQSRGGVWTGEIIDSLMNEFIMFDMLLISVNHQKLLGGFKYYGFNFLSIFNGFIPSHINPLWVNQFDHQHTTNIFKGHFNGAIPTSIFGSLYLNFSFLGVLIGGIILGTLFFIVGKKTIESKRLTNIIIYSLFTTFIYDIFRVGDVGREFWTFMIYLIIFYIIRFFYGKDIVKRSVDNITDS